MRPLDLECKVGEIITFDGREYVCTATTQAIAITPATFIISLVAVGATVLAIWFWLRMRSI